MPLGQLGLLVVLGALVAPGQSRSTEFDTVGPFLDGLMVEHGVPGFGFALFDDSGLLYEHVGGVKSQTTLEPGDTQTAFEAASISKPVFAYVVRSLAREGVLDLDTPLQTLIPELPELAQDPRADRLTPRLLLTHRGGLPPTGAAASSSAREAMPGSSARTTGSSSSWTRTPRIAIQAKATSFCSASWKS